MLFDVCPQLVAQLLPLLDTPGISKCVAQLLASLQNICCTCNGALDAGVDPKAPTHLLEHWAEVWAAPLLHVLTQAQPLVSVFYDVFLPRLFTDVPEALPLLVARLVQSFADPARLPSEPVLCAIIALLKIGRQLGLVGS
jgi:hypothetical protein